MTGDAGTTSVLIIDTDNVRRGMLACSLPANRYSLEFANNEEKGLDLLGRIQPEVVVVGWNSPSDLCQRIRSLPAGRSCTLILMDERFRDEAVARGAAEAAGADAFLPFPFELELLEDRLRNHVETKEASLTPATLPAMMEAPERPVEPRRDRGDEDGWDAFRGRVDAIHGQLDSTSYYRLLEVPETAGTGAIKQAFFARSIEFHPDRFMRLSDEELRARIYDIFKRMSEAFKVLINPEARRNYDANLSGPAPEVRYVERAHRPLAVEDPTADARTPAGKKFLHHAVLAEVEGKLRSARMYLSMALQCEPDNEELHVRLEQVTRRLGI